MFKTYQLFLWAFIIYFNPLSIANEEKISEPVVISFGPGCQVAGFLNIFNVRRESYPFDWLATLDFAGFKKMFQENFLNFLDKRYLIKDLDGKGIKNTYYNIYFVHDFPLKSDNKFAEFVDGGLIVDNYLDYLDKVKEKFDRRIKRLQSLLNSSRKFIFIRTEMLPYEAKELADLLTQKYPHLDFTLVSVHGKENLNKDWHLPRIKNFFASKYAKHPALKVYNYFDPCEWEIIFRTLGIGIKIPEGGTEKKIEELFGKNNPRSRFLPRTMGLGAVETNRQ